MIFELCVINTLVTITDSNLKTNKTCFMSLANIYKFRFKIVVCVLNNLLISDCITKVNKATNIDCINFKK